MNWVSSIFRSINEFPKSNNRTTGPNKSYNVCLTEKCCLEYKINRLGEIHLISHMMNVSTQKSMDKAQ
uniref:Uncharacterized protein n=1 Tax=Octopus bimaculoides TaxID=37653 RepID=A0A0L8HNV9_OCTBM